MKKTTIFVKTLVLLCTMIFWGALLAACGQKPVTNNADTALSSTASKDTQSQGGTVRSSYEKHITFTINAINAEKAGTDINGNPDTVFEWLKQKYNFDFEWIPVTWDDFLLEKPRLWMASDDQPDLMMLDISPARYPVFLDWAKNGMLQAYPSFGERYSNLQRVWDTGINGKKFAIDGKVYAWPSFLDTSQYGYVAPKAWFYRVDWAEKVGLRTPNDEYTWDQWLILMKTVIEKDPAGNGPGKTIGSIGPDWTFPRCLEGPRSTSPYLLTYTRKDGQWIWGPQLPESLEAVKETRKLYDDGLIWKDQIVVKNSDDVNNKFIAGKLFSTTSVNAGVGAINSMFAQFKMLYPGIDPSKAFGWAVVKGHDGTVITEKMSDHWTETTMSPRLPQEKVERWMDILDYLVSDEGYYMRNFGIPGEDWELKDGKLDLKWPTDENGVLQGPSGLNWDRSQQWAVRAGCSDLAQLENPLFPEWARNRIKQINDRMQKPDVTVIPFEVELNYFDGPKYTKVGTLEMEIYQEIAKLMVSKNLEKDWNEWVSTQMPRIQPVLDELNANLK
jgi:putative aldouronate transport system substrate-binding protein